MEYIVEDFEYEKFGSDGCIEFRDILPKYLFLNNGIIDNILFRLDIMINSGPRSYESFAKCVIDVLKFIRGSKLDRLRLITEEIVKDDEMVKSLMMFGHMMNIAQITWDVKSFILDKIIRRVFHLNVSLKWVSEIKTLICDMSPIRININNTKEPQTMYLLFKEWPSLTYRDFRTMTEESRMTLDPSIKELEIKYSYIV